MMHVLLRSQCQNRDCRCRPVRRLLIAAVLGLIGVTTNSTSAAAAPSPEARAMTALCKIGLKANGIWGSNRINEAIAVLDAGDSWRRVEPEAQAYAYKVCNYGGYLKN